MSEPGTLVTIVDDDESMRESLPDLLREFGFDCRAFDSAATFLFSDAVLDTDCLLLDIAMPGMSGPELQRHLIEKGLHIPTIFITAHSDANARAGLIAKGAVDCLFKPFGDEDLRAALARALAEK